jgi:hypothetical protein
MKILSRHSVRTNEALGIGIGPRGSPRVRMISTPSALNTSSKRRHMMYRAGADRPPAFVPA